MWYTWYAHKLCVLTSESAISSSASRPFKFFLYIYDQMTHNLSSKMSSRLPKKIIVTAVVFVSAIIVLHGINKEYFVTGPSPNKPGYIDVGRIWRASGQKAQSNTIQIPNNTTSYMQKDSNLQVATENASIQQAQHPGPRGPDIIGPRGPDIIGPREPANAARINEGMEVGSTCKRKNNIGFFKMHKCGSSTVQNILMRYGVRYDLNFVLPPSGNYLGQTYFNKRFVMSFPVHEYNILCHHTRFSKEGFVSVLPPDSTYVTIIRDPATMYESTFTYLKYNSRYGVSLATFLENPQHYYQPNKGKDHAKDSMLYDLGMENELKTDPAAVDKKIQRIASEFDLVMMTEYFSESLILLKEIMCWDFQDIAYFKMNARSASSIRTITDQTAQKIREWNNGDTKLYNYFNRTFWEKVSIFGEDRMRREVAKLEEMNQMLKDRCIDKVVVNDKQVWHPSGINVESFKLKASVANDEDCQLMAKTELPFTAYVRQRQLAKYFGRKAPVL